jgi:RimJ/RimL family protein N-acetyltransferase
MISIPLDTGVVRSWTMDDLESLVAHANNRRVWINLRDAFPHPYTRRDGREFLRRTRAASPETTFAIAVDDAAVGAIGFVVRTDVVRVSARRSGGAASRRARLPRSRATRSKHMP